MKNVNDPVFDLNPSTYDILGPDGVTYTLRERNGNDESILGRVEDFKNQTAISKFLAAVIIGPKKFTAIEVQQLPIRVRNYLMLMERCHEYGDKIEWEHTFRDDDSKVAWEEDLTQFFNCPKYPESKKITGKLSSGKVYQMDFLTGEMDVKLSLEKPLGDITINDRFTQRNFELQDGNGVWRRIERFDMMNSKDMRELRKVVEEQDPEYNFMLTIKNPRTEVKETVSLLFITDFFFQ